MLGDVYYEKGDYLTARAEYRRFLDRYADQAGSLIDRAQDRFDEIRFGRGLEHLRDGRCR